MKQIKATVFIPTFNGETYLEEILKMVFSQKTDFAYEVLVIDSGSSDGTMDILAEFKRNHSNLRVETIPNTEFGHGKTRQFAAEISNGEIMAYITHDATPANETWLSELVAPFSLHEKVVAVLGKQDPRYHCFPLMKYDIQHVFRMQGPDSAGIALYYDGPFMKQKSVRDLAGFYSDVNSATKREFLLNTIPYKDVPYAEDMLFGSEIIKAGYIKVYNPRANVWHSNDIKLSEYKFRMFDEVLALRKQGHDVRPASWLSLMKAITIDQLRILNDGQYSAKRKLYWLLLNPLYHFERRRGVKLASKSKIEDARIEKHSLEHKKKQSTL